MAGRGGGVMEEEEDDGLGGGCGDWVGELGRKILSSITD